MLVAALAPRQAQASPEWNAGVTTSLCGLGESGVYFEELAWCNALHGDVLFGRERGADFALGPYVDVSTRDFADLRWGGGASLLLPIIDDFPLVVSVGPYLNGIENLGLHTALFWGLRSYNFHGNYVMTAGLVLAAENDFGERPANALLAGVQIDGMWLALPFILGYEAIRGSD
jgi:hypothetical protein